MDEWPGEYDLLCPVYRHLPTVSPQLYSCYFLMWNHIPDIVGYCSSGHSLPFLCFGCTVPSTGRPFYILLTFPLGFPGGASGKEPACQCRRRKRRSLIPESERSPGGGPLAMGNCIDRGAGELQSVGSQGVRHDWSDLAYMHDLSSMFRLTFYLLHETIPSHTASFFS